MSSDVPIPPAPAAPKFCRQCGTPWMPDWADCPHCAKRVELLVIPDEGRPIGSALALYFCWLGLSTIAAFWAIAGGDELTVDVAQSIAASVLVLCWCIPARGQLMPALRRVPHVKWFGLAFIGAFATFAAASGALRALQWLCDLREIRYTDVYFDAGYGWALSILLVCVQPAIFEELAFRGVIFSSLRRILNARETVLVSALMFMILHLAVPSFVHLFLIGLILGWMRHRTGSLYPGMVLHFTHNLLCVLAERSIT